MPSREPPPRRSRVPRLTSGPRLRKLEGVGGEDAVELQGQLRGEGVRLGLPVAAGEAVDGRRGLPQLEAWAAQG